MRDDQVSKAAQSAHDYSRRPIRPVLTPVPSSKWVDEPGKRSMRASVSYPRRTPITWKQARAQGKAYARVLEQLPTWPTDQEKLLLGLVKTTSARPKKVERPRTDPRGDWWLDKIADVIDQRVAQGPPSRSAARRAKRKLRLEGGLGRYWPESR